MKHPDWVWACDFSFTAKRKVPPERHAPLMRAPGRGMCVRTTSYRINFCGLCSDWRQRALMERCAFSMLQTVESCCPSMLTGT